MPFFRMLPQIALLLFLVLSAVSAVSPGTAQAQLLGADPLIDAVERDNFDAVKKALLGGSSANIRGGNRYTALMIASGIGSLDTVE
ncbi:MAG: hypothetical protein HN394_17915, partial [Rhodospirillaceae bacterium]|nr:hypothetical protein [Rhodospirillaceae bacterium]